MANKLPFHAILANERERRGYSVHEAARGVSVPKATYESWEKGEGFPTRREFGRLCAHFPQLRHHRPDVFEEAPVPKPSTDTDQKRTFGACLREVREREGMDQDEIGALFGVTAQAVSSWELDKSPPVRENYQGLVALLPHLRDAPEPDWRDIPVPDGRRGVPRSDPTPAPPPPPEQHMANPSTPLTHNMTLPSKSVDPTKLATEDLTEFVIRGYIRVFGGSGWGLTTTIEGNEFVVKITSDDRPQMRTKGKSVKDCLHDLRKWLNDEINKRIAELEELRRSV